MNFKSPRQTLSKAFLKSSVTRSEMEQFKQAFTTMFAKVDEAENEEHLKNVVRDFLLDAYYKGKYEINVKDRNDLVIHNGPKTSDSVGVIIEAKSIKNKAEMVSRKDLNKKALQELILYYLREREDNKNINVKQLIITNAVEWFVFDENDFEKLIFRNTKFLKQYKAYKQSGKDTKHFYESIAKPFIEKIKEELPYTWFDVSKYETVVTNDDQVDDAKLIALFKLLSPTHILKQSFANDSNSLNRNFYNELLHIIGLEEVKEKNKKVISRKADDKREPASLLENAINILKYETNVSEPKQYETALELCITWINRILFLKLLESQLVKYNKGNREYQFLNYDKISDYDTLNRLFFQVLAIRPEDRRPNIKEAYSKVPYLNSSLFEVNELEAKTLKISNLEDTELLSIHPKTVMKDAKGKKLEGSINPLEYLFRFLEAYDFSSEGGEQIQEEDKTLINASVLGLIFEKINGYKDGSFFTPGFITMYMCRETLRRSVIQKFKDNTDFDSEDWDELKNYIGRPYKKDELKAHNSLIDSLKVCDPAVGSGHFLVSALNEVIAIKSELGILCNADYVKLPVIASVDNDELIIQNDNEDHDLYEYDYSNAESQNIQMTLFEQKQTIIENCLFGVDINPNSVKICRLRLWIELLKNAYYTPESKFTDLETLPNIDINIKCGNSLISRFDLDSDLKPALKKSKFTIDSYKAAVASYKTATNKADKQQFKDLINGIKSDFRSVVRSKELIDLQKLEGQFYDRFGAATLLDVELTKTEAKKKEKEKKKLKDRINKKKADIEEIKNNIIYENAFEWRFEFPEVLDADGDYVGFDVVIGNPPYIRQEEFTSLKPYLEPNYNTYKGTADLYVYFIEKGLNIGKIGCQFIYIIPNKWMRVSYGDNLRSFLLQNKIESISDFGDLPVFEEATTYPCILGVSKMKPLNKFQATIIETLSFSDGLSNYIKNKQFVISTNKLSNDGWALTPVHIQDLIEKIKSKGKTIQEYTNGKVYRGVLTGLNAAFVIDKETKNKIIKEDNNSSKIIKPFLIGRDIKRYSKSQPQKWLIFTQRGIDIDKYPVVKKYLQQFKNQLTPKPKDWKGKWDGRKSGNYKWYEIQDAVAYWEEFETEKIVYPNICKQPEFTIDHLNYLNQKCYIIANNDKGILAILNSRLYHFLFKHLLPKLRGDFYEPSSKYFMKFPIVEPDEELRSIANKLLHSTVADDDLNVLESHINKIVYQLYDLTPEEIEIIENSIA